MFLPLVVFSVTAAQPDKAVWSKTVRYGRSRSSQLVAIESSDDMHTDERRTAHANVRLIKYIPLLVVFVGVRCFR